MSHWPRSHHVFPVSDGSRVTCMQVALIVRTKERKRERKKRQGRLLSVRYGEEVYMYGVLSV